MKDTLGETGIHKGETIVISNYSSPCQRLLEILNLMRETGIHIRATIILALLLLTFTSCEKPQEDVCGVILGGYNQINYTTGLVDYYFRLNTDSSVRVDPLTFISHRVGDYVCLYY